MFMPDRPRQVQVEYNHAISMRDGVTLRGDLYLPIGKEKLPVLLLRGIFRKERMSRGWGVYDPALFNAQGYAVYIQDVRGLGQSDGIFRRFTADGPDGYDTVEALAAEPWCNGNVGMFGNYYAAYLQLMAAALHPPHLRAIAPFQTHVTLNRDNNNRGFLFASHIGWCMAREINRLQDGRYPESVAQKCLPRLLEYMKDYASMAKTRPLSAMPVLGMQELDIIREYRENVLYGYDDLEAIHREGRDMDLSQLDVPALYYSGWYESARNSMIEQCVAQRGTGQGNARESEVIISPLAPGQPTSAPDAALDFRREGFSMEDELLRWFDKWLKRVPVTEKPPFRIYDPGARGWKMLDSWREQGAAQRQAFLGAGALRWTPPEGEAPPDTYLYDPDHPAPFAGIGMDCACLAQRGDTLCYVTEPLESAIAVCGLIRVRLYVSSTAVDTDFMVRVLDVAPDGGELCVSDGAVRAKYRDSWTPSLLTPGQVYLLDIPAGHTAYTFQPGRRVGLQITSSCELRYDCNHNTGNRPEEDARSLTATNTVHRSQAHPSHILLPLAEERRKV